MRSMFAALALLCASLAGATPAQGVDMACAGHNEWDSIGPGLTVPQVRNIIGGTGHDEDFQKPGQYGIWWPLCWRDDKVGVVWFSDISDLSLSKNVVVEP